MVLYINCAIHVPGGKFGHPPGVDILHRLIIGKSSNINISKTKWLILITLHTLGKAGAILFLADRTGTQDAMATYTFLWKKMKTILL